MRKTALFTLAVFALALFSKVEADDSIKLKNRFENDIVFLIKPESAKAWTRIKIADGKTGELKVDFSGKCVIKIEVITENEKGESREFQIGLFDLKKLIGENDIKELQIHVDVVDAKDLAKELESQPKSNSTSKGKKTKKMVAVTKYRDETRTRMVTVNRADGTVVEVPQTFTVKVPYTEMVEAEVDSDAEIGDGKKTDDVQSDVEFVPETRTRTVSVTKVRPEKRTRDIEVVDETTGEKKIVTVTYHVNVPYTETQEQTYTVKVPKVKSSGGKTASRGGKKDAGLVIRPIVTFKKDGKTVRLHHSLGKK
jgi:hypothetical protein